MYPELIAAELEALEYYAAKNGRRWKSKLSDAWMRADDDLPVLLYRLRNTHGPSWLAGFRFPVKV